MTKEQRDELRAACKRMLCGPRAYRDRKHSEYHDINIVADACPDALDQIDALERERDELRALLRRVVDATDNTVSKLPPQWQMHIGNGREMVEEIRVRLAKT